MQTEEYIKQIIHSQKIKPESAELKTLNAHKEEITKFLRSEFGTDPIIKYAGSYAKGTMIKESYDLDVVCYFPSSDSRSLKEIHDDVAKKLQQQYLIEEKTTAVRILDLKGANSPDGYHIDIVPGRFIEDSSDVFLHVHYGEKERMQTNLKTHVNYIAQSGCEDIIQLTKLWSCRNNVNIKTFILELFVVRTLEGSRNKTNPKKAFLEVLEGFRKEFGSLQLIDPANTNNIVSKLISQSHQSLVAGSAKQALDEIAVSDTLSTWQTVFGDEHTQTSSTRSPASTVIRNPSGQWSN